MTTATATMSHRVSIVDSVQALGVFITRYGLVAIFAWIGAMKFTAYEAQGIQPLIAHSPFMSWLYAVFSVRTFSTLLGIFELTAALLLSVKPMSPRASIVGSLMSIGLFVATISFLFTTPDIFDAAAGGFPLLSADGGFLIKDVALLGLAVWTLADALAARDTPSGG